MQKPSLELALGELVNNKSTYRITATFEAMRIAETIMQRYGNPKGLFLLLRPTEVLQGVGKRALKAHMIEIAMRFKQGADTRPATAAEVLAGMLGASTKAPLNSTATLLCEKLSRRILRYRSDYVGRETYPGQLREIYIEAKRKLTQPWRKV
jgi:hypothetical protein